MAAQQHAPVLHGDLKRKRSPSHDTHHAASAPLAKTAKTHNHLQINYLVRQINDDLPLITNDDTLPSILSLLGDYQGVLDRHESMACNLGARPLGPILIKRFERLFDGPPRVLKSNGKDVTNVTWLDVVEFARNKPEQFQLGQMSEGVRVCQFYTKQCRVQISEEDFVLISSGIPQKMIPPQPIVEDEEKELGTIEILEKNLGQICQLADQGELSLLLCNAHNQYMHLQRKQQQLLYCEYLRRLRTSLPRLTCLSRCPHATAQSQTQGSQTSHPRPASHSKPCATRPSYEPIKCGSHERRHFRSP
jgi:hypothetical protein